MAKTKQADALNDTGETIETPESVPAPKKTTRKKTAAKKTATKKTAVKKTAAKETAKKTTTRKSTAKTAGAGKSRAVAQDFSAEGKNLIIVESPAKARTIERYLGADYRVVASVGHVIDLPASKLGVDVDNNFQPEYVVIKGKKPILDGLKRAAKQALSVYLAPDPDREGEAIAYHIAEMLKGSNANIYRATFNEITKTAVRKAIENPGQINFNLFQAQQARRVLDRLVGYKLSPLLWKKVRRGLSAGRVQSVAVRIICDREREINIFQKDEYWTIQGLADAGIPPTFVIHLAKINGKKAEINNQEASDAILADLKGRDFTVGEVIKKEVSKRPFAPFITSTLQQEAARKLRLTAKRTMALAQGLYEGQELGALGTVGLITYMRTDSVQVAQQAPSAKPAAISARFSARITCRTTCASTPPRKAPRTLTKPSGRPTSA